jgi:hypothetical protein
MSKPVSDNGVQGEGDYVAGRRFQDAEQAFLKKEPIEEKAREAAEALDGPQAKELEAARISTGEGDIHASRHPRQKGPDSEVGGEAESQDGRDQALDDSFPASDPTSPSPGSD